MSNAQKRVIDALDAYESRHPNGKLFELVNLHGVVTLTVEDIRDALEEARESGFDAALDARGLDGF